MERERENESRKHKIRLRAKLVPKVHSLGPCTPCCKIYQIEEQKGGKKGRRLSQELR